MAGIHLLSEVHPRTSPDLLLLDPIGQSHDWFGFFSEMTDARTYFAGWSFVDKIQRIYDEVERRDGTLILRDWTHLDFTAFPHIDNPAHRFSIYDDLAERFDIVATAIVRHPIPQYRSHRALLTDELPVERTALVDKIFSPEFYVESYRRFATEAAKIGFHRYEDFVANPDLFMYRLCNALKMRFDATYSLHWRDNHKLTGAVEERTNEIGIVERSPLSTDLQARLTNNPSYHSAVTLLGYA
jgi:hypothetical protein